MRFRAKVDANHAEIVNSLRRVGSSVLSLAAMGKGCPDLLVGKDGKNYLLEVKGAKGILTQDQEEFVMLWRGRVRVVRTSEEAIQAVTQGD